MIRVTREALQDAELEPSEVDLIVVGHFNGGLNRQGFAAPLALHAHRALRFKPVVRAESACASGSAAIYLGLQAIRSGDASRVLVIGVEVMSGAEPSQVGDILLRASYLPEERENTHGFAGVFARIAENYSATYGDVSLAMAKVAAKNHANGVRNPLAQFRTALSVEFCDTVCGRNPYVAPPLRRTDCAPVSDGAAAIVLSSSDIPSRKAVAFRAACTATDYLALGRRSALRFEGCAQAWSEALAKAGASLADLSLVETHDCFTIAEILQYEAMSLTKQGQGRMAIEEGWTEFGGRLPVNPSGGLKSKGHPIGATGVSQHIMASMQVLGLAGQMQIPGASLAGVFNMGGVAVSNYCSILEPIR